MGVKFPCLAPLLINWTSATGLWLTSYSQPNHANQYYLGVFSFKASIIDVLMGVAIAIAGSYTSSTPMHFTWAIGVALKWQIVGYNYLILPIGGEMGTSRISWYKIIYSLLSSSVMSLRYWYNSRDAIPMENGTELQLSIDSKRVALNTPI